PWMLDLFLPPCDPLILRRWLVIAALAAASVAVLRLSQRRAWHLTVLAFAVVPFFAIPLWGRVENYPHLHTPELEQLVTWAKTNTPRDAMFVFPAAGRQLYPGVFRVEAERSLYVDWKSGGQANYYESIAEEWRARWKQVRQYGPSTVPALCNAGVNYVVLPRAQRLAGVT